MTAIDCWMAPNELSGNMAMLPEALRMGGRRLFVCHVSHVFWFVGCFFFVSLLSFLFVPLILCLLVCLQFGLASQFVVLFVYLLVCLIACLLVGWLVLSNCFVVFVCFLFACLLACLFACLFVCLFVLFCFVLFCLVVCLFVWLVGWSVGAEPLCLGVSSQGEMGGAGQL